MLPRVDSAKKRTLLLRGGTENIAKGGICVLSDHPIPANSLVRCELMLDSTSVGIPALLQVRWMEKAADNAGFRIGLQFLV